MGEIWEILKVTQQEVEEAMGILLTVVAAPTPPPGPHHTAPIEAFSTPM